jgi:hypothetical protein
MLELNGAVSVRTCSELFAVNASLVVAKRTAFVPDTRPARPLNVPVIVPRAVQLVPSKLNFCTPLFPAT